MKVVRDTTITEKDLFYKPRRKRIVNQTWDEYWWEMEQNHPNFMEFPDDGPRGWPLVGQTSNPYEVDMTDVEKL